MVFRMTMSQAGRTIAMVYFDKEKPCNLCTKKVSTRMCPSCHSATLCEDCFLDFHSKGHKKLHNYKRIMYGEEPINYKENRSGDSNKNVKVIEKAQEKVTTNIVEIEKKQGGTTQIKNEQINELKAAKTVTFKISAEDLDFLKGAN